MAQIEVGKELQLQYDISPTCLRLGSVLQMIHQNLFPKRQ